jgi:deazaflavin-dependent oxidoreductase (nitroreductase family)
LDKHYYGGQAMTTDRNNWNENVIKEFRANAGKVGQFGSMPLLLLHHKGAKSNKAYVNPLAYLPVGDAMAIFASKAGAPTNPDWYHNLVAHPDVQVEVDGKPPVAARARVATGEERERLYREQASRVPVFAEYEQKTKGTREIPVVVIDKV